MILIDFYILYRSKLNFRNDYNRNRLSYFFLVRLINYYLANIISLKFKIKLKTVLKLK